MVMKMYPPIPIPGFAPNFTGYEFDRLDLNWNEIYKFMAQSTNNTVFSVSVKANLYELETVINK